ncbi:DUF1919 domain-containing protein [Aeromonas caviae]|uniref:DUF1919 domain-containing protein n=1 Tax=Aeromonas caviae TaxID=648 RepID=UPI00312CAA87
MWCFMSNSHQMLMKIKNKILKFYFKHKISISIDVHNPPTFISSNCIGTRLYLVRNIPFYSPTIGMWFEPDCFYKLVTNLEYYLSLELEHLDLNGKCNYPMGSLGDIKVHLMHYDTFSDAKEKWQRRLKRVNYSNIIIINTDRDGCTKEKLKRIHENSKYPIVSFVSNECEILNKCDNVVVYLKEYSKNECVGDLYTEYHQLALSFPYKVLQND